MLPDTQHEADRPFPGRRSAPARFGALASALLATAVSAQPRDGSVEMRTLVEGGGRLDWNAQGDRLAYDGPDEAREDGLFDVWVLDRGSARGRCLTCTAPDFRHQHAINPAWHPSGEQIVFQTVALARRTGIDAVDLTGPQRANRSEIWLARTDGKHFWKLTDFRKIGSAVLDPSFSWEGRRLVWAERFRSRAGEHGAWRLRTASIRIRRGVPRLAELEVELEPDEPTLVIPHGFTLDDRGFLFSANLDGSPHSDAVDVYLQPANGDPQRLTRTGGSSEDVARFQPDGRRITFVSDSTLRRGETAGELPVRELWIMEPSGDDQRRLTWFNEPPADEYLGPTWVGDFDWHPDGGSLAVQVVSGRTGEAAIVELRWIEPEGDPTDP